MSVRRLVGAGAMTVAALLPAAVAVAQDEYDYVGAPPPQLESTNLDPDVVVLGTTTHRDAMPITGGDLLGLTVIGLGAVGTGAILVRRGRTRGTTA